MNELLELQKVLIENELRRHYIRELVGDRYDALVCFLLAFYGMTTGEGSTNGLARTVGEIGK